ncbi:type VII secretion target [Saccharopolyspora taberi]|uniref:Excreted virulence factor EspC, type VII ESX diderm n=1 Tax=Saccharopolyspora taberi TaxID=60895 RepID=A0ABN3V9Z4_9PSEU
MSFEVVSEELTAHASHLDGLVDRMDSAIEAAEQVSMADEAYGLLCSFLPPIVNPMEEEGMNALKAASEGISTTADNVRSTAKNYQETDDANSDSFKPLDEAQHSAVPAWRSRDVGQGGGGGEPAEPARTAREQGEPLEPAMEPRQRAEPLERALTAREQAEPFERVVMPAKQAEPAEPVMEPKERAEPLEREVTQPSHAWRPVSGSLNDAPEAPFQRVQPPEQADPRQ